MTAGSAAQPIGAGRAAAVIRADCAPSTGSQRDYDELIDSVRDARIVLIGEASHGGLDEPPEPDPFAVEERASEELP